MLGCWTIRSFPAWLTLVLVLVLAIGRSGGEPVGAPSPPQARLYITSEGDDRILFVDFNPATGDLTAPAAQHSTSLGPADIVVLRDASRMLVSHTDGLIDVYRIEANGNLTLMSNLSLGGGTTFRLSESQLSRSSGEPYRIYGIQRSPSQIVVLELDAAGLSLSHCRTIPFAGSLPTDLQCLPAASDLELVLVSGGDSSLWAFQMPRDLPAGPVTRFQYLLESTSELADFQLRLSSGPILEVLDLGAGKLISLAVDPSQPINNLLGARADLPVQSRPRGLAVDSNSGVAYFGSEHLSTIEGVALDAPPASGVILPGSPYAASGSGLVTLPTNKLLLVLTSQRTLQAFVRRANRSLSPVSSVSLPGSGRVQDMEAVIFSQ